MRILVTGASGRLGTALLPRLAEAGHEVRAMSRQSRRDDSVEWVQADLSSGDGLPDAVRGIDVVVHLASAPYQRGYTKQVDVHGTGRLVEASRAAAVGRLLYLSIVGIDQVPWAYYRRKLEAEELVKAGGVPWTILRATQFHEFMDEMMGRLSRLPVLLVDPRIPGQPVDVRNVAGHLVTLVETPANQTVEFGGPEIIRGTDAVRGWATSRGVRRPLVRVRIPGRLGAAFRSGALTTSAVPRGRTTWAEYLSGRYGTAT